MNELKKYLWQKKMMKIKYILICILGFDRVKYLKQHNVFAGNFYFLRCRGAGMPINPVCRKNGKQR